MKIFIAHSSGYNYKQELYEPIQQSELFSKYEIILPLLKKEYETSQETIKLCNLILAEVSFPSTGAGIELGYADIFRIPIVCFFKKGTTYSGALKKVTKQFVEYDNTEDLIPTLGQCIEEYSNRR